MDENLVMCPTCSGKGGSMAFVDGRDARGKRFGEVRRMPCVSCGGSGRIAPEQAARIWAGRAHRAERAERRESASAAAARLGVSVQDLTKMEMGRIPFPAQEKPRG